MCLSKGIEALKKLTDIRRELDAKTVDKKLIEHSFFERTSKLFEPLIDSNVKVNDNLKRVGKGVLNNRMQP